MVITESKVNLVSNRLYNETLSQGRFTAAKNGRNPIYAQSGANFSSSYAAKENHSNSAKEKYFSSADENTRSSAYYGLFTYSRNAKLVADEGNTGNSYDINLANGSLADNPEVVSSGSDIAENAGINTINSNNNNKNNSLLYSTAREQIFLSILEILRRLSFRRDFEYFSNSYYNTANVLGNSNALSITNSDNASVWTIKETYSTFYKEAEYTSFSGNGTIVTADGMEVNFNVTMEMSRSYMEENTLTYITKFPKILTDPLVINLGCNAVDIQDKTFLFDLDCDGKEEEIAVLAKGCGYLALDHNGDGVINDGSELFGTLSGDGFKDLAAYDSDGNGWIDEADDVYKNLKVWTTDDSSKPILMSLKDADVGAVYLGSSKTQFDLKDNKNELKGRIRSSGIYLHEDGTAGTIQQVDF